MPSPLGKVVSSVHIFGLDIRRIGPLTCRGYDSAVREPKYWQTAGEVVTHSRMAALSLPSFSLRDVLSWASSAFFIYGSELVLPLEFEKCA